MAQPDGGPEPSAQDDTGEAARDDNGGTAHDTGEAARDTPHLSSWREASGSPPHPVTVPQGGTGVLVLAGTPIGDVRYVSAALREALLGADVIAAEDTRKFADLCRRADVHPTAAVVSFFDGNESARTPGLIAAAEAGARVVVVTDAGMPSVSDPGFRLVGGAIAAGVPVTAVPGPSAVLAALAVSGLPTDRFCFEGFLPRKAGPRRARLAELAAEPRTMVFFEAPHRLAACLTDMAGAFGQTRPGAVCRELTKRYEEVVRGTLGELAEWAGEVRGEITLVVGGATVVPVDMETLVDKVRERVAAGQKLSSAVAQVAAETGADRHELYDAARS